MKHNNILKILRILMLVCVLVPFTNAVTLTDNEAISVITDDTFIVTVGADATNYGTDTSLDITSSTNGARVSYINFDMSEYTYNENSNREFDIIVTEAYLTWYQKSVETDPITTDYYYCNDTDGFDELVLTNGNKNTYVTNCEATPFLSASMNDGTGWKSINLTDKINQYNQSNFVIRVQPDPLGYNSGYNGISFYSKESGNKPRLNLVYEELITTTLQPYYNTENISVTINTALSSNISYDMGFYLTKLLGFNNSIVNGVTLINDKITLSNTFDDGIVAYYPLTTDSLDYSGNGNDGTEYNGVVASGTSYEFDGVDDYVGVSSITLSTEFTISFWVKTPEDTESKFLLGHSSGTNKVGFYNGQFYYRITNGGSSNAATAINEDEWTFYSIKRDLDNKVYLSIDSSAYDYKFTENGDSVWNLIGDTSTPAQNFNGSIADMRIYNRSLSSTEIINLYNESRKRLGLVLDLPLRDTEEDYSPANNAITLYNGANIDEDGAHFDGVDDYVSIPDNNSLNFGTSDVTFSFNIKSNGLQTADNRGIITKRGSGDFFTFTSQSDGLGIKWRLYDGTINYQFVSYNYMIYDEFVNIVAIIDYTNEELRTYKNGIYYNTYNLNGITSFDNINNLEIGAENSANYFNGSIKDVKIYNRALSESEIQDLYAEYNHKESTSTYTNLFDLSDYDNRSYCQIDGTTLDWGTSSYYTLQVDGTSRNLNEWFYYGGDTEVNLTFTLYDTNEYEKSFEIKDVSVYCGAEPTYTMEYVLWNDTTTGTLNLFNLTEGGHELNLYLQAGADTFNYSYSFITDYTTPVLTQLSSYQEGYKFYFYDTFDVDELYIDTCYYQTNGVNKSCDQTQYYTTNGLYNINVTLKDLAGNTFTQTSYPLTINASYTFVELNSYELNVTDFCYNTSTCTFLDLNTSFTIANTSYTVPYNGETYWLRTYNNETVAENVTLWVNPLINIVIYDSIRDLYVTGFSLNGDNDINGTVSYLLYDEGLGGNSYDFSSQGYNNQTFYYTYTTTMSTNITFNATLVTITLQVYDESNSTNQLNFTLSMNDGTNYVQYLNQVNFSKFYNETLTGNLTLTIESPGYALRKIYTQLMPFTAVSHIIYLKETENTTPVIFRTLNLAQTQAIEDVVFTFKKEIAGVPTFLAQAKTDSQGYTYFNMDILTDYEIIISKNGYVSQIINSIPGKTDYTILMEEEGSTNSFLFDDFSYRMTPTSDKVSSSFTATATTFDESSLISSMRFTVTGDNFSITQVITNPNGGRIDFNISNSSSQYVLNLTVFREGQEYNFIKKINYYPESSSNASVGKVADELDGEENNASRVFIIIIIYISAIVLGSLISPTIGAVAGLLPIAIFAMPTVAWITPGIAALMFVFTILGVLYFEK